MSSDDTSDFYLITLKYIKIIEDAATDWMKAQSIASGTPPLDEREQAAFILGVRGAVAAMFSTTQPIDQVLALGLLPVIQAVVDLNEPH